MQTNFNSNYSTDRLIDESLIDYLFPQDVVDMFYADDIIDSFEEGVMDFGGGITGITCRSVIAATDGDPDNLIKILRLRKTSANKSLCQTIIGDCKRELASAAYVF